MTQLKPELSRENKYHIERHRYYELYHFCRQYEIWKKALHGLDGLASSGCCLAVQKSQDEHQMDRVIMARDHYRTLIELVERAAYETDDLLSDYILIGVTKGLTYNQLQMRHHIPCCRGVYYDRYRKFFWILSHSRN